MLTLFLNRNSFLACLADCPADNHARQLAQFLYETLHTMPPKRNINLNDCDMGTFFNRENKRITGLALAVILISFLALKFIFNW